MKLENWQVIQQGDIHVIIGDIYGDERNKFRDGENVRTSPVRLIDFENKQVITENSCYDLGALAIGTRMNPKKTDNAKPKTRFNYDTVER